MEATNWGKYANNMKTLLIQKTINLDFDQNVEFDVTVPNVFNFPHKNRCVVMIDTLSISAVSNENTNIKTRNFFAEDYPELWSLPTIGVSLDGMGVVNSYDTISNQNNIVGICPLHTEKALSTEHSGGMTFVYQNTGSIHTCGSLCQSPFGKSMRVRLFDLASGSAGQTSLNPLKSQRRETTVTASIPGGYAMPNTAIPIDLPTYGGTNHAIKIDDEVFEDDNTLIGTVTAISGAGNQITLSSAATITDDEILTIRAPDEQKEYVININIKMLFVDEEDMKEV